jgi:DNA-binding protein Fis
LRERPGDILPLAEHFLRVYAQRARLDEVSISAEFVRRLLDYSWPGNVRELENVVHRAILTCREGRIDADDFPLGSGREMALLQEASALPDPSTAALERALLDLYESGEPTLFDRIASTVITTAFRFCHGNQSETARLLGISRNILRARLLQFGLLSDRRVDASSSRAPTSLVDEHRHAWPRSVRGGVVAASKPLLSGQHFCTGCVARAATGASERMARAWQCVPADSWRRH